MNWLIDSVVQVSAGFAHQGVARLFPFRRQTHRPEVAWDIAGMLAGVLFVTAYYLCADPIIAWLYDSSAMGSWHELIARWPAVLMFAGNLILLDFCMYWAHRILHTSAFWPTHAWHHSSRFLYWASGLRGSLVHVVLLLASATIAHLIFPLNPDFGVAVLGYSLFHTINQHYLHSNIYLPYQHVLERVFVTPRAHFVHHSKNPNLSNSNYGFVFSIWDRLFGTFTDPASVPEGDPLGIDYEISNLRLLIGLPSHSDWRTSPVERPAK